MKMKILLLAAILASSSTYAQIADSVLTNDPVTITATKTNRKQSETGKVLTIISKNEIQNNIGKSLSQLLIQKAGVFIAGANNAPGSNQELYIRGNGKVLILLNGIPILDASTINNSYDLNNIDLESLEKIEILKGAQSTLYGSDAIAGVVNLITNKTINKETEGSIHLSGGSYGTYKGSFGLNGTTDGTNYQLQLSRWKSDGFSAAFDSSGTKNFDKDGMTQTVFNGAISGPVTKNLTLGVQTQLGAYAAEADGSAFTDDKDFSIKNNNFNIGLTSKYTGKKSVVVANFTLLQINRNYFNDSFDVSGFSLYSKEKYTGNSYFSEIYTTRKLTKNLEFIAGADYRSLNSNQDYLSVSAFGPYKTTIGNDSVKQNMKSIFGSMLWNGSNGIHVEAGARYNQHSSYGNNTTFTFNPSYAFTKNLRLFFNISSAFKAPSLYQLFGPGVENRALLAENSVTYEAGAQYTKQKINIRAVYFNRNIKNGIDYNLNSFAYFNNNHQKDQGFELEASAKLGQFTFNGNYSFVTGKVNTKKYIYDATNYVYNITGDTLYNNLFRRPKHSLNVSIGYQPSPVWYFSTSLRSIGKRQEGQFLAAPTDLASYYTIDGFVSYTCNKKLRLYADWRNMTNQQYFEVLGYNSRGNNFMAGIQIMF